MSASWTLDYALEHRFKARALEPQFKAYWSDADRANAIYRVWHDTEARAQNPKPYLIYERMAGLRTGNSSGSGCEPENNVEYWTIPVQLRVHAHDSRENGYAGKTICKDLIVLLIAAFEDAAGVLSFPTGGDDRHVQTHVGADICMREGDREWKWILPLEIEIERRRRIRGL